MITFSRFILRHSGWLTLLGLLLSVIGGNYSVSLYKNLRTDIEELLPTTARSVLDLSEVTQRLESIDNLAVLISSKNTQASKRFVDDLAKSLEKAPKDTIAGVEYRIDRELQFFKARQALYMELPDLHRIRDYIRNRIQYEKALYNPLNIFSEVEIPEPRLDFMALQNKYSSRTSSFSRFPGGYYATPDEQERVVLIYMPGKSSGVGTVYKLKHYVEKSIEELKPSTYAPDLLVRYTGGVQNTIEEHEALISDLGVSSVIVLAAVSIALFVYFWAFRATLALLLTLFAGTFWTFGLSYFAVGYLNANSAFLGSIIIGNGINFGIIYLARYLEERRNGENNERAIEVSISQTATATLTAALAAGLSYGSLILTGFRGFKQFGTIGLIGMVICWVATYTLLPAMLTAMDRWKPLVPPGRKPARSIFAEQVARFISVFPRPIWWASMGLTILSIAMYSRYDSSILEANLAKLRNKKSMEEGSGYLSKHVDEIFQRYLSPMVILPRKREEVGKIADILRKQKAAEGDKSLIAAVSTLDDFVPTHQEEKIEVLREIQALLPPKILRRMAPTDQAQVREFLTPEAFRTMKMTDLPQLVLSKFTERDGSVGKLVLVEPPISNETLDKDNLIKFIRSLRSAADAVAPGTPVAGTLPISADMIEAISVDGPKATLFAFIAVFLLIVLLFRNLETIGLCLFALILGMIWMGGLIFGFHLKINFLNFIALPITFGIGVDYGVNIFQRYRQEGSDSILRVLRDTGGAVTLCSFTTMVGYSSLLLAENQAFVSFGLLSVLGEITCIIAALFSLPAFLLLQARRKKTS